MDNETNHDTSKNAVTPMQQQRMMTLDGNGNVDVDVFAVHTPGATSQCPSFIKQQLQYEQKVHTPDIIVQPRTPILQKNHPN